VVHILLVIYPKKNIKNLTINERKGIILWKCGTQSLAKKRKIWTLKYVYLDK